MNSVKRGKPTTNTAYKFQEESWGRTTLQSAGRKRRMGGNAHPKCPHLSQVDSQDKATEGKEGKGIEKFHKRGEKRAFVPEKEERRPAGYRASSTIVGREGLWVEHANCQL